MAHFDVSELRHLQVDLAYAPERAYDEVRATTQKAALNIKKDLQAEAQAAGSRHFSGVAASISYETGWDRDGVWAEIGPEQGRAQGSLAWIAYEGHATTGPVFPDPSGALEREADAFETYLARAIVGTIL